MSQDPRFANFTESQLYSVLVEIFAATTDFTNYYIGRRAEESFLDSAKLRSSVTLLSKMLGYVVQRPIPATTSIQIKLKTAGGAGNRFDLPKGSVFSFEGINFILKDTISYTLTQTDINNFATNPNYYITLEFYSKDSVGELKPTEQISDDSKVPVYLIQGETKTYDLAPSDNSLINSRFQTYKISDKTFSNMYGSEDYGYDNSTGSVNVIENITRVGVGVSENAAFADSASETSFNGSGEFKIDRRSFLNDSTFLSLSGKGSGKTTKYCVIRTAMDDTVEVLFADDNIGKIGPRTGEHLYVRYLSTKGASSNKIGVSGKLVFCQASSFGSFDSSNVEFYFRKNITGGSDIESIESMKVNAPGIFYSLDRCVSSKDYVNFLKTLTSPINVKNAIAWGEQEETADKIISNIKMFNVVLFSILGSMYHKEYVNGNLMYNKLSDSTDSFELTATNQWFNLLIAGDSVTPLRDDVYGSDLEDVGLVYSKLKNRSQATVKNVYISPIIKDLKIGGYVYLNALADRINIDKKIRNAVYAYLDENADFDIPVYISNLIQLIEEFPEVHHADIKLMSPEENYTDLATLNTTWDAMSVSGISATYSTDYVGKIYNEVINERSISEPGFTTSLSIYNSALVEYLSAYSIGTRTAILCRLPKLETKTYKLDPTKNGSGSYVRNEIVWPSNNKWNKRYCRIALSGDSTKDVIDFPPSERNFYIGMMKCTYDKLSSIATKQSDSKTLLDFVEGYISNVNNAVCCSLKSGSQVTLTENVDCDSTESVSNSNPSEVSHFLENYFELVTELFRNSFINDLQNGLLDSYSNAVNYSMKNEIVRITAPELTQYVYYR